MKNMVPCKACAKNFEYIPGFAGNAPQLCEDCKKFMDAEEVQRLSDESIIENNKYLKGNMFDPIGILLDGDIPTFNNDAEKFICARELALFVCKTQGGIIGMEDNLVKLFNEFDIVHVMIFMKQQTLSLLKTMAKHKKFRDITKRIIDLAPVRTNVSWHEPMLIKSETGWQCKLPYK